MLDKLLNSKKDEKINKKATDRLDYMRGTVPAWETPTTSLRKARSYQGYMERFDGWVYASAQIIARACSAQPIKLYSKKPQNGIKSLYPTKDVSRSKHAYLKGQTEGKPSIFVQRKAMQGDMVEVFNHPILDLLDNPSPEMDGYTLAIQRFLNLQLTGNAYLHPIISETLGIPVELWNMQSDMVAIIPDGEMDLVDYYQYGVLPNVVDFRKDEVLHEKQPNPSDAFYGRGWVSAALSAIDLLESMDDYEQSVLDNQARPDWAIMVKEHLTDSQYQRLMQQVERQLGGKNNRSKPFIFEGGTDGKPMQFSPNDLAFASGEARKVEVIAAISGVPVSMLKANDPNLASAREGSLGFLRNTIRPYLTLDEAFLNRQLLPLFGGFADDLVLCYDDPVAVDKQLEAQLDASDASAGIRTRNEIRIERGLEPIEGGDELLVPVGSIPIDMAIEQARNPMGMFGSYQLGDQLKAEEKEEVVEVSEDSNAEEVINEEQVEEQVEGEVREELALNGAQVTAALEIVNLVTTGQMPRDSAIGQLMTFFNLSQEQAESVMGEVGQGFTPSPIVDEEIVTLSKTKGEECVQAKIPILMDEGYDKDQAVAIAYAMCYEGGYKGDIKKKNDCGCGEKNINEYRCMFGKKKAPVDTNNDDFKERERDFEKASSKFEDDLTRIFKMQIENFLDNGMTDLALFNDEAISKLDNAADEFTRSVLGKAGQDELDRLVPDFELSFDFLSPSISEALQDYKIQLSGTLQDGTQRALERHIETGIRNGLNMEQIAQSVRDELIEEPDTGIIPIRARARMIARTEVALISEEAKLLAWDESGVVTRKQWQVSAGGCVSCQAMGDLHPRPIPLNQPFAKMNDTIGEIKVWSPTPNLGLMHPPLHPNCRCGMVELLDDETDLEYLEQLTEDTRENEFARARARVLLERQSGKIDADEADRKIEQLENQYGR